jgi:chromosome segregation ATPase
MVRFLLTLALLCALGTVGFGYYNRAKLGRLVQDLASARQEDDRTKKAIAQLQQRLKSGEERQAGELKIMQDQQQKLASDLAATKAHLDRATEQLELRDKENKALTAALTQAGQNIEQKQRAESERNALAGRLIRSKTRLTSSASAWRRRQPQKANPGRPRPSRERFFR